MPRFQQMGVSAVVDGYRDYINNVGKMASATERSHSRIGRLGSIGFKGVVSGAKLATGAILGIGAAAATATAAIGGIAVKLAIDAAPIVDLELGFNAIAENAGQVGTEVLAAMKDVTAGTIRAADLMQLYNKGTTLLGDNFQTIIPFMDQIIAQGAAIGLKPLQAVEDFTTGVARESKMILDNLGIIVRIDDATETYASTLGKAASELTATERQTAILNSAMTSLEKTSKALPSLNEFATTSLEAMKVTMQETKDEIGKALVPALVELVNEFQNALGPEAENIVEIFKRDFVPTLTEMARFIGANLPKAIKFARDAFIFLGRIVRGMWDFIKKFVIPGFNFLYRIFVDKIAPIVSRVGEFFGELFDRFRDNIPTIDELKQKLIDMIPQSVLDAWETVKTKAGELWDSFIDLKPDIIRAWDEIKQEAEDTFGDLIPGWLENLNEIWTNLITLITGDMDRTKGNLDSWGAKFIEVIGDIITLGLDILAIAIEGVIDLILILTGALVGLATGDWSLLGEAFTRTGLSARDLIGGFGEDIMDLLNIPGPSTTPIPGTPSQQTHGGIGPSQAPPILDPATGVHLGASPSTTQNFSLTVNTSAPVEPVIADFRMLAALARGPIP